MKHLLLLIRPIGILAAPAEAAQAANAVEAVAAHKPYWCGDLGKNAICRIGGCLIGESSKFWDEGCPNGSYYCCVEE